MKRFKIKAFIDALLDRHEIERFPVNMDRWLQIAGAELRSHNFHNDMSGFAYQKKGLKIIGVNKDEPHDRQRFTIAHELGHMFLHKDKVVNYDRSSIMLRGNAHVGVGVEPKEIEANIFAAELLMPEECIRADIENYGGLDLEDDKKLKELASKYGVSVPAMTIRLNILYFS